MLTEAGFRHAFFLRTGGVSSGPYRSLNFSYAVADEPTAVGENLERGAQSLGVGIGDLYFLAQVHGTQVREVSIGDSHLEVRQQEGDGIVSSTPGIACAVRTADCVPILLADPRSGRVAALHAGWRGVVGNIVRAGMQSLQVPPERVLAAIGPHISVDAFEISEDVAAQLEEASGAPRPILRRQGRKPHGDLRAIVRHQLQECGLAAAQVDDVLGCTHSESDLFFSYRRDGQQSGRHLSAILPRATAAASGTPA